MGKRKSYLLVLLYVLFLLVLVEGSARVLFFIPQIPNRLWTDEQAEWWRDDWIERHRTTGREILYAFDIYDSSKGWAVSPNLKDRRVFETEKVLSTNSKGLRGKNEYSYGKNKDRPRIVILGDSFTFGENVSDNETYAYYLQELLPHAEIINMGVHGYGHDQMLILLEEEGVKYEPDFVMLGFLPMDMSRNLLAFRDYAKPRFVSVDGELKLTGTPVPRPEDVLRWDWVRPRTADIFSFMRYGFEKLSDLYPEKVRRITRAILARLIEVTESIPAVPIFVYLPAGEEISEDVALTEGEEFLFSVCKTNDKVKCFSTRPYFAETIAKEAVFESSFHWGPEGHHAVAEAIRRYLVDEGLVVGRSP